MISGRLRQWLVIGVAVLTWSACGASQPLTDCEAGSELCPCRADGKCNSGLECRSTICVEAHTDPTNDNLSSSTDTSSGSGGTGAAAPTTSTASDASFGNQGTGQGGVLIVPTGGTRTATSSPFGANTSNTASGGGSGSPSTTTDGTPPLTSGGGAVSFPELDYQAVNLYIMVDASTSMVDNEADDMTRWQFVTEGIEAFLREPELARVHLSLQFFGWLNELSCDSLNYSLPEVPLGKVHDVEADIVLALEERIPGGLTPTFAALSGAHSYAKSFAQLNPNHYNAVVFITDGYPTRCEPLDLPSIAVLALDAHQLAPSVATHVIGIDGNYGMDPVAMAGGTGRVTVLENTGNAGKMRDALYDIATQPLEER